MAMWVLLRIDDHEQAERMIKDMRDYPDADLLTPGQENEVHATIQWYITEDGGIVEVDG